MYTYDYNCCAVPYTPVCNEAKTGGFTFILVLFILLAIICSCGGFGVEEVECCDECEFRRDRGRDCHHECC